MPHAVRVSAAAAVMALASGGLAQEPYRQTLTSAGRDVRLASFQVTSRDLDPASKETWSVRKTTLHGGKQEGVDLVVIDNGKLAIIVIPTRGMGILRVTAGDVRLRLGLAGEGGGFQVIYHSNYGPPLLEGGSRFLGPVESVFPLNAHAGEAISRFTEYGPPVRGFIEEVYCIKPLADAQGRTAIALRNAAADRGVILRFSTRELPFVSLWKNLTALEEGYVTGLEPGTGFAFNRRIERRAGRVPRLAPGASRSFTIDFEVLEGVPGWRPPRPRSRRSAPDVRPGSIPPLPGRSEASRALRYTAMGCCCSGGCPRGGVKLPSSPRP